MPLSTVVKVHWKVTRSLVSYDLVTSTSKFCSNWKVTRSLVSYDRWGFALLIVNRLKGHQIIGELRPLTQSPPEQATFIERSPDHWWVTTWAKYSFNLAAHWKVTRSLVSYDLRSYNQVKVKPHWKVTRSLVSYDFFASVLMSEAKLKGHQIIGELRPDNKKHYIW